MSQDNVEVVRRALTFWGELGGRTEPKPIPDLLPDAALQELLDPDVQMIPSAEGLLSGNMYRGYQGVRSFWADFFTTWDEFWAEPERLIDNGAQVVSIVHMRGRAHGLDVDEVWSHIWTVRRGRIVRVQTFTTADGALEAAGLPE
jgi:ketosteroid isomerase-like protein